MQRLFFLRPRRTVRIETSAPGFSVGWKTVKGDLTIVPICPIAPITPIGSTPFREGIKVGIRTARRRSEIGIGRIEYKNSYALTAIKDHAETLEDFSRDLSVNGIQRSPDFGVA